MKIEEKIEKVLNSIRPYLNSDGGDIEFIKYQDKIVYVKLLGGCAGCPHRNATINNGIFEALKNEIPEVENVINLDL